MKLSATTRPSLQLQPRTKGQSPVSRMRLKPLMTVTLLASSGVLLSGCVTDGRFATLSNGACGSLPRAEYQIRGADRYSQQWSDKTVEAEVAGCGFKRPKAVAQPKPVSKPVSADTPPVKFKKRWLSRFFRDRAQ